MANTYLTKTFSSAGTRTKYTISVWVKRGELGSTQCIFSAGTDANHSMTISFNGGDDRLYWNSYSNNGASYDYFLNCTRRFRDPNAWYHIVCAYDSTQGTSSNRQKIYVNGVQETAFETETYSGNFSDYAFNNILHEIGQDVGNGSRFFNGSMSHYYGIDGLAYAPTVFGEIDATDGIWKGKPNPSVTMGTNGFTILKDSNTITDQSSNSNDWALGGGTLTPTKDNPDNNFATLNPLTVDTGGAKTYTNGNTTATETANSWTSTHSTLMATTGKYYCETKLVSFSGGSASYVGSSSAYSIQSKANAGSILGTDTGSVGYYASNGNVDKAGASASYGATWGAGDIIGTALDLDNNFIYFSKNGVWQNSGDPTSGATGTGGVALPSGMTGGEFIGFSISPNESVMAVNYGNGYFQTTAISSAGTNASGNGTFEYDVPTGYTALSTKGINT